MLTTEQYYKKPNETIPEYNDRIAKAEASASSNFRDVSLQGGNPVGLSNLSSGTASNVSSSVPTIAPQVQGNDQLNSIMSLMQQYQSGMRSNAYQGQQQQALQGVNLPSSLIGASPSQQNSVLKSQSDALQPTINGANQAFSDIGDIIGTVKNWQAQKRQQQADIYKRVHDDLTANPDAYKNYSPQDTVELEKEAGMPKGSIDAYRNGLKAQQQKDNELKNAQTAYFKALAAGVNVPTFNSAGVPTGGGGSSTSAPTVPTLASGATPEEINQALTTGSPVQGYEQGTLYNAAVYDMLGIPTSTLGGMGSAKARAAVGNKENQIMQAYGLTPVDVAAAKAEYKALTGANTKLIGQATFIKTYTATATDNLDLALAQSGEVSRTGAKIANKYVQWARGNFTPAGPLATFETYIYTAAREYAKVTSGGAMSAQGLTDSAQREAAQLLNSTQSPQAFEAAVNAMKKDMANVNVEFNNSIAAFAPNVSKILGIGGGTQVGQPTGSSASQTRVVNGVNYVKGSDGLWHKQ